MVNVWNQFSKQTFSIFVWLFGDISWTWKPKFLRMIQIVLHIRRLCSKVFWMVFMFRYLFTSSASSEWVSLDFDICQSERNLEIFQGFFFYIPVRREVLLIIFIAVRLTHERVHNIKGMKNKFLQVNNYESVVNFSISAITWHDIQQSFINLPEFTLFVQLMNWQNNSCRFV